MNTTSHSMTTTVPLHEVDPAWWDNYIQSISKMHADGLKALQEQVEPAVPTYYIRYEDLVLNPQAILSELFQFLLEVRSIEGTVIEKRI